MKKVVTLFLTFLKIGAFTFGGGYAMIALLENEFVMKRRWLTDEEFLDMVAIAESTPGPVAINSATYVGYRISGMTGAIAATIAVSLPSFVIIYIISLFFEQFLRLRYVSLAFRGISVCVVYLILSAGIKMLKNIERKPFEIMIYIIVLLVMTILSITSVKFSSIYYIVISGVVGIVMYIVHHNYT